MFLKKEPALAISRGSGSLSARMALTIERIDCGLKSVMSCSAR